MNWDVLRVVAVFLTGAYAMAMLISFLEGWRRAFYVSIPFTLIGLFVTVLAIVKAWG